MRLKRDATSVLVRARTILTIAVGLLGGVALLGWVLNVDLLEAGSR